MCAIYYSSYIFEREREKNSQIPTILSFYKIISNTKEPKRYLEISKILFIYLFFSVDYTCEPELVCVPIGDFPVLGAIWYPKQYEISLQKKEMSEMDVENS